MCGVNLLCRQCSVMRCVAKLTFVEASDVLVEFCGSVSPDDVTHKDAHLPGRELRSHSNETGIVSSWRSLQQWSCILSSFIPDAQTGSP